MIIGITKNLLMFTTHRQQNNNVIVKNSSKPTKSVTLSEKYLIKGIMSIMGNSRY